MASFPLAYPRVEPQAVLASMEQKRYSECIDDTLVYLRQLACLLESKAVPVKPMLFHVCDASDRSMTTSDTAAELVWRAISVSRSAGLTSSQCRRVIGLLLPHIESRPAKAAYERMRVQCLWIKVRGIVNGTEPHDPRVVEWSYMLQAAMRLPGGYVDAVAGMVAHTYGMWDKAAEAWKRARDEHRYALTPAQTDFLSRYDAGMYKCTQTVDMPKHISCDPLTSPGNKLFRQGNNPLEEIVFTTEN